MEKARQGGDLGRKGFEERQQCNVDKRKTSFGSRIQDPWNQLDDSVKKAKNPRALRNAHKKTKNLIQNTECTCQCFLMQ